MNSLRTLAVAALLTTPAFADVRCQQSDDHIVINRNESHVLTYNKTDAVPEGVDQKYARSGFIHPISTPSGKVLTDGYPLPHHTHQHGLFFAWKKATYEGEEVNFWEPNPTGAIVRHDKVLEIINEDEEAGFRVRLIHMKGGQAILRETWTVRVHAKSGYIDFESKQACATNSPLTIERHHYGAMAIRGSRQWFDLDFERAEAAAAKSGTKLKVPEPCKMFTSGGHDRANGNHTRPNWVCMSGPVDGETVAVTLFAHPTNFRHPQHVRIHPTMPYFCFIPAVEKGFQLKPGKPYVSRFRITAEDGDPDPARLNRLQEEFAAKKLPER